MLGRTRNLLASSFAIKRLGCAYRFGSDLFRGGDYGSHSFDMNTMKERLPSDIFESFENSLNKRTPVTHEVCEAIAVAVRKWAEERGATHFTHLFHPLSGVTAEKHDVWLSVASGKPLTKFAAKNLISNEPDASSFPNGGLRQTHQARGNVLWDPASPMYVVANGADSLGSTLKIPALFIGWDGNALDKKTPLLRSEEALQKSTLNLLSACGDNSHYKVVADCGVEQEFFLVDEELYENRPDLKSCGRTLIGNLPSRTQSHSDRYYGALPTNVLKIVHEAETFGWALGTPLVTRHCEVAPSQYEMAPHFQRANIASDANMRQMEVVRKAARDHGMVALFHEKPYKGINGSGKHNNWSIGTNNIPTLFEPSNPHFLVAITAFIRGVNLHQDVIRCSIASASNDHRLGSHEAPPAIMSIYLGEDINNILTAFMETGKVVIGCSTDDKVADYGVSYLPFFKRQAGDRNRTSPIAFTGNKFEMRAVGSSHNPSDSSTVLNAIIAQSMDYITEQIHKAKAAGNKNAVNDVIKKVLKDNYRIVFNGDGYSNDWRVEAEKRGLLNLPKTPHALKHMNSPKNRELFSSLKILNHQELEARVNVAYDNYCHDIEVEIKTLIELVYQFVLPSANKQLNDYTGSESTEVFAPIINSISTHSTALIKETQNLESIYSKIYQKDLTSEVKADMIVDEVLMAMSVIRKHADALEAIIDDDNWTLPKYRELFTRGHLV